MLQIKTFTFNPVQENTYLLYNEAGEACLIDPGCYFPHEEKQLDDFVLAKGLKVVLLINTHCHLDHVFGLRWAAAHYGLTPHIHPNEEMVLKQGAITGKMWGLPFVNYEGPLVWLAENQTIKLGQDELQVIFAPGHSPGHVCFYCKKQGFVINGDVLFRESIGRTDLPGGNHRVLIESIQTQLLTLPDATVVYTGHGPSTTIGYEKRNNPYLNMAAWSN